MENTWEQDRCGEARPLHRMQSVADDQLSYNRHIRCSCNAVLGKRGKMTTSMEPAAVIKKVLVVGGGIAEWKLREQAARRGHKSNAGGAE